MHAKPLEAPIKSYRVAHHFLTFVIIISILSLIFPLSLIKMRSFVLSTALAAGMAKAYTVCPPASTFPSIYTEKHLPR